MKFAKQMLSFFCFFALSIGSCSNSIKTIDEYNAWLNESRNGCIKTKTIAGINVDVKYQPPSYVVLKQLSARKGMSEASRDSIMAVQNKLLTFLITIGPDKNLAKEKRAGSVMYEGISNQGEYNERVLQMNFFMEQYVRLYIDGKEQQPVLALVENLYELSDSRTFVLVFAPLTANENLLKGKEYLFEYDDPFFNLGKVQMNFAGEKLLLAREINIAWN
ncbi:MAG: hypothetical protein EOP56_18890 [Sphingobacteriales bacterium]|nr:MAG: hypothetical protein EOP56_18890 [Sphingobacteriales bacterium]